MFRQNRYGGQYTRRFAATAAPAAPQPDMAAPRRMALAMAYLEDQKFEDLYDLPGALARGTLFKELDMPFHGCFKI